MKRDYRNYDGENYIRAFPETKKWINECICCHKKGYKPDMPETINSPWGKTVKANQIRKYFKPLAVNADSLCEVCAKLVVPASK